MVTDLNAIRICIPLCTVKESPDHNAKASSELLFGERIEILQLLGSWAKIRTIEDGYTGFVENTSYESTLINATHWVSNRATFIFESADIKSPVVNRLLFGSQVSLSMCNIDSNFMCVENIGFIWAGHCQSANAKSSLSLIELAQNNYLDAPYLWGGRSSDGCDCSGLVQMLAKAKGISIPRDSGDQENALPLNVSYENRQSGNLVFWPGHVGILKTENLILHSTAHTLRCCVEPLASVIERAGLPSSIKQIT